ncbi:hypothetical protein ACTVJH_01485 [Desulfoplanes sp. PS50]|jgi:hypothetical protein
MCPFSTHCKFFIFFQQSDNPQVKASIRNICRNEKTWQGCVRALMIKKNGRADLAADIGPEGRVL